VKQITSIVISEHYFSSEKSLSIPKYISVVSGMMSDTTTIKVKKDTRDKLKDRGKKGESYDEIINRLIDRVDGMG